MKAPSLKVLSAALLTSVTFAAQPASATTWNIVDVLSGTGDFGASLFHSASGGNVMSGTTLLDFTSWNISGTYNDATGQIDATVTNPGNSAQFFSLTSAASGGDFSFGGNGALSNTASLEVDFSAALTTSSLFDTLLTFTPGYVCCGTVPGDDPNSFSTTSGIIALWGASHYNFDTYRYQKAYNRFGLDLRLGLTEIQEITPVPLPAGMSMFVGALGLIGFLGWRRRRETSAT